MTKIIFGLAAVSMLVLGACTASSSSNEDNKENQVENAVTQAHDQNFIGDYVEPYDGSRLQISKGSNDSINVTIDLFRLTLIDDGVGQVNGGDLDFKATDANGEPIQGKITLDADTACLTFTNSTWEYLPNGTTFRFERAANEASDSASNSASESDSEN